MFNESITLILAYFVMVMNGITSDALQSAEVGTIMTRVLYICWLVNVTVIVYTAIKEGIIKCKLRKQRKKAIK